MEFRRSILEGVEIKRCRNVAHAKPHVHNELSLGYIIEGSANLSFKEKTLLYESGDGVIIPPLMTHQCAPREIDHWAYDMLFVSPGYYSDAVRFSRAKKLAGHQARKLKRFIGQLLQERTPDALENILIELLLEFGDRDNSESAANAGAAIETIHDYILSHLRDDLTLDKLQQISGLNKFTMIRNFKKSYLTTPAAYHLQNRVAEAKQLLSRGAAQKKVKESTRV
jgi:hypothetical protein